MNLTSDQLHHYFEVRLGTSLPHRNKIAVKCCFHDDGTASATVFLDGNGGWNCQSCGAKGNVYQFETRFSKCSMEDAKKHIAEITGAELDKTGARGPCTAVYDYRLVDGSVAFQKRRYAGLDGRKTFSILRPDGNGWASGLEGLEVSRRVLYNLPDVVTANLVFVAEGEKDCATLDALNLFPAQPDIRTAATTNFEGAWQSGHSPKWLPQYNPYFAGKRVIIFEDNDESGRAWAEHISAQIYPFAEQVRRISFPELPEKGDVSDWMESHSEDDLRKLIVKAPKWLPNGETEKRREMLISAIQFAKHAEDKVDWLIDGVIQRGANGFFSAAPKSGKSWIALDALISLATGCPWLDCEIPQPIRCGYISREDGANLTAWRMMALFQGKTGGDMGLLEKNLYINSRRETPKFFLDCEDDVQELVADIQRLQLEFVVLDVFNRLHTADENDNQAMSAVMAQVIKLSTQSGAAIGIVHHYAKSTEGNMTQRLRGAGAIGGFAEWQIGIWTEDEEKKIRGIEFETKAAEPKERFFFQIQSEQMVRRTKIVRVTHEANEQPVRKLRKV